MIKYKLLKIEIKNKKIKILLSILKMMRLLTRKKIKSHIKNKIQITKSSKSRKPYDIYYRKLFFTNYIS